MTKRIFLAGASGAIGRRLTPLLVAHGWTVVASTRAQDKASLLREMGAEPVVVDVFDADALRAIMTEARPDVVIHQLTDLPYALEESEMTAALVRNARLRDEGTRNLVTAAVDAGARRLIAQSISFVYADGPLPHGEADPLLPLSHPVYGETAEGVRSLERQVIDAPLEGIVLRYGLLYGPGTGFDAPIAPGIGACGRGGQGCRARGHDGAGWRLQRHRDRWDHVERGGHRGIRMGCRLARLTAHRPRLSGQRERPAREDPNRRSPDRRGVTLARAPRASDPASRSGRRRARAAARSQGETGRPQPVVAPVRGTTTDGGVEPTLGFEPRSCCLRNRTLGVRPELSRAMAAGRASRYSVR